MTQAKRAVIAAGGASHVARKFGIGRAAVSAWGVRGVPAKYVVRLCQMTGGLFTPAEIRPDVFGK